MDRVKRIWYLSPMRAAKVQASLRIRAVSPEPPLLAHTSSESSGTIRQKARSLAPLNGWACAVKICHDGMLEDTNSLDGAHIFCLICFTCINHFAAKLICNIQFYASHMKKSRIKADTSKWLLHLKKRFFFLICSLFLLFFLRCLSFPFMFAFALD